MTTRPLLVAALAFSSLGAVAALAWNPPSDRSSLPFQELAPVGPIQDIPTEPLVRELDLDIHEGDNLGALMRQADAPLADVLAAAKPVYDLTHLREGKAIHVVYYDPDPMPVTMTYALDEDRTLVLTREGSAWTGRVDAITYDPRPGVRDVVVKTSLWQASIDAGLRPADIAALAAVFECDVDFNTEIQPGAIARMALDELWTGGALAKLGPPHAVRFRNGGKTYMAIRYTDKEGHTGYYDDQGMSRKKAFLRSPLAFSRVTSGFSRSRMHPILGFSRPHLGVDFGAPEGTPVRAVGDGVVARAGVAGGAGNFVKLDHNGPYSSGYAHLSRIAVKLGEKVKQGQVIGYVGSTGLATGPHLHFQFWVNGAFVNPLTLNMPASEPLPADEMAAFTAQRDQWLASLDGTSGAARGDPSPGANVVAVPVRLPHGPSRAAPDPAPRL